MPCDTNSRAIPGRGVPSGARGIVKPRGAAPAHAAMDRGVAAGRARGETGSRGGWFGPRRDTGDRKFGREGRGSRRSLINVWIRLRVCASALLARVPSRAILHYRSLCAQTPVPSNKKTPRPSGRGVDEGQRGQVSAVISPRSLSILGVVDEVFASSGCASL